MLHLPFRHNRAANISQVAAAKMKAALVRGLCVQSELPHELAQGKAFMAGTTKQGQPCVLMKGARHDAKGRDLEQCKRGICFTLDRAAEQARPTLWPSAPCNTFHASSLHHGGTSCQLLSIVFSSTNCQLFFHPECLHVYNRSRYNHCRACVAGSNLQGSPLLPALLMALFEGQHAVNSSHHLRVLSVFVLLTRCLLFDK